ncbi:MAG: hypothetical protein J4215_02850 [Candidatus Diapherotrites archaeon]|uniref:Uncharacterized protein n=1 Tax=Candidatus Iainarchaeum sp. TaxID=3101447 RepID=A0A8T4LDX3_9ARCH|nr:hypothetical protein [Candidatus Diapherotrites archaeon]
MYVPVRTDWNFISFIWTHQRSPHAKEFKKNFGLTPAQQIFEEFSKNGMRFFSHNETTPAGNRFLDWFRRGNFVRKTGENIFEFNPETEHPKTNPRSAMRRIVHR